MTILLSAGMVGATFAYFTDVERSNGNTFTAGTLDVKIKGDLGDFSDDMGPEWTLTNLGAGANLYSRDWTFQNFGTIPIDHMEISCSYSVTEDVPNAEPDPDPNTPLHPEMMSRWFTIKELTVRYSTGGDVSLLSLLADTNGNGVIDLEDLHNVGIDNVIVVPAPFQANYTVVDMTLEFSSEASNDVQGDTLIVDFVFTFNQHATE